MNDFLTSCTPDERDNLKDLVYHRGIPVFVRWLNSKVHGIPLVAIDKEDIKEVKYLQGKFHTFAEVMEFIGETREVLKDKESDG